MINNILLFAGSGVIIVWGIGHIIPTRGVVRGFGEISGDNRKIITMEWLAEGLALIFIGVLALAVTLVSGPPLATANLVYLVSAGMLLVMAGLTAATGARTSIIPIKICPAVKTAVAVLFILGVVV